MESKRELECLIGDVRIYRGCGGSGTRSRRVGDGGGWDCSLWGLLGGSWGALWSVDGAGGGVQRGYRGPVGRDGLCMNFWGFPMGLMGASWGSMGY